MNATISARDVAGRIPRNIDHTGHPTSHSSQNDGHYALTGLLYRFHGFRVLDCDGKQVGLVDWIWPHAAGGEAEFIGVQLQWLRGRVRAIPALRARVDIQTSTIHLAFKKEHIERAGRFSIDRELTADQKQSIGVHYGLERAAGTRSHVAEGVPA